MKISAAKLAQVNGNCRGSGVGGRGSGVRVLTRAGLDAGGPEAELLVLVGDGLVGGRHVGGGGGTVVLTHTAVVKMTTRLQRDTWSLVIV